jgi:hypothetical protein
LIAFVTLVVVTLLTQVGGVVFIVSWLVSRLVLSRRLHGWHLVLSNTVLFVGLYAVTSIVAIPPLAALGGRVPLPCFEEKGRPFAAGHWVYCVLNRHYVDERVLSLLAELSRAVDRAHPETSTLFLDANLPFIIGFPLLPHLSHHDGRKLDIAYYYAAPNGSYLRGQMRSPIGYWAFEQPGERDVSPCESRSWLSLRWDFNRLQEYFPVRPLEPERTRTALRWLVTEGQAFGVERIFVEPHLATRLGIKSPLLGFQGCRAARHDDHIHVQIKP